MIRPLRQRHRRMVAVLGIVLPIAFVAGIAARKPIPTVKELPASLAAVSQSFESSEWKRADLFAKAPVEVHLLREQKSSGRFAIELSAARDFLKPDLMVYWAAGNPNIADTLPDDVILLGSFYARPLPLPDEITRASGRLVLFSLADNEIVDISKSVRFDASTK